MAQTQLPGKQIGPLDLTTEVTGVLPTANGGTGASSITGAGIVDTTTAQSLASKTLVDPQVYFDIYDANNNKIVGLAHTSSAVNYLLVGNAASGGTPFIGPAGPAADIDLSIVSKGGGRIFANGGAVMNESSTQTVTNKAIALGSNTVTGTIAQFNTACTDADFATLAGSDTLTNKTLTSPSISSPAVTGTPTFASGIAAANLPNGLTNGNTSAQSQLVVSGTSYYIAGSNLTLPATLKAGMAVGTRFRWRVAMAKTNAGTGAFAIEIRRGTAGTTADTADVSQSIGTQTAAVDSMVVDVEMVVTTTGATGAYYWTIIPVNKASLTVTANTAPIPAGFGVATGATGQFSGTVSSVAMNTTSLIFGLSFKATTGTPTITIPLVQSSAINIS